MLRKKMDFATGSSPSSSSTSNCRILPQWLISMLMMMTITVVKAGDPYLFFTWNVSYGTLSPLGVPQRVILINDKFPGPDLNVTTNNNLVINVFNNLDEPLLFTWNGLQLRKNSWYDGTPGTMCPIQPGTNFTYQIQAKDQIGSFTYYPTTNFQKAAGGFGSLRVNSRPLIPVPFDPPEDDYTVLIGDWYTQNHNTLRALLDHGRSLGKPDGVLMNGSPGSLQESDPPLFTMKPGKTYRYRICNVGLRNSLNFRIQNHKMKLVEIEGSHTEQTNYDSLDIHLGQCNSVLVTANQHPKDYYMVASTRFTKYHLQATRKVRYESGSGKAASDSLPEAPLGWAWSLNQFRTLRWNLTASAARPNPQGSYRYGQINITRTIKLVNTAGSVDGKLRYAVSGYSHVDPETPLKLAEYFGEAEKVFKYDIIIPDDPRKPESNDGQISITPIVVNATFRNFVEIIFENHEKGVQSWHLDGYAFFPVAIEVGQWSPDRRKSYNMLDAVSRYTIQVYPKSWAAVLLSFDNCGMWNLRSECLERSYLGQQLYISVLSPERSNRDEYSLQPDITLCGIVKDLPPPPPYT